MNLPCMESRLLEAHVFNTVIAFKGFPAAAVEGLPPHLLMNHEPWTTPDWTISSYQRGGPQSWQPATPMTRKLEWTDLRLARAAGEAESLWPS